MMICTYTLHIYPTVNLTAMPAFGYLKTLAIMKFGMEK